MADESAVKKVDAPVADHTEGEEHEQIKAELQKNDAGDSVANDQGSSAEKKDAPQEKQYVEIQVPKAILKYNLKPQVISDANIIFYNAQKSYYERSLKHPALLLWLLCDNLEPNYTAKRIFETAWKNNIQVKIVETSKFDMVVSQDGLSHILYEGVKVEKMPDAVLPRMGARITYFSLAVVRQLEKMGVLVLNKIESLEISKDKLYTTQTLAAHNLPIPKTMIAKFPIELEAINKEFKYPIILKKSSGSQGKGVMLIQNQESLNDIADMIDDSKPLIFQEFISKSHGRDIRVIVVGGKAIGGMMRVAKKGFKSNFHQGGFVKPVKLSPAIEWLAIEATKLIGLDIAGVDILIDENTYKICEINSTPGFQGFELATGINVAQHILDFVKLRCGIWQKQEGKKAKIMVPVQAEHLLPDIVPDLSPRPTPENVDVSSVPQLQEKI